MARSLEISPARSVHSSAGHSLVHTPSSSVPSTPILPARPPSPERRSLHPEDSSTFLTTLAAQERRVLELKEELERAESDLERLKRQWASHETSKKKSEIRQLEQLRPISKSGSSTNPFSDSLPGTSTEHEGRKIPSINTKQSQRKVFSGSRHARALSLLSPKLSANQRMMPPPSTVPTEPKKVGNGTARSITVVANALTSIARTGSNKGGFKEPETAPPKDAILETGKQFVGDLREGLWTFFEDLKQATVGDEIVNSDSRNLSSGRNMNAARKRDNSHQGHGIVKASNQGAANTPSVRSSNTKDRKLDCPRAGEEIGCLDMECKSDPASHSLTKTDTEPRKPLNPSDSDDDGWDNWDSPKAKDPLPRWNRSSNPSDQTTSTTSSPRTSISSPDTPPRSTQAPKRDEIPWPTLTKLTRGNLKRTASTLMSEWERSLTPPAEEISGAGSVPRAATPVKQNKAD